MPTMSRTPAAISMPNEAKRLTDPFLSCTQVAANLSTLRRVGSSSSSSSNNNNNIVITTASARSPGSRIKG